MGISGWEVGGGDGGGRGRELGMERVVELEVGPSHRGIGSAVLEFARLGMVFGGGRGGGGGGGGGDRSPEVGLGGEAGGGAGGWEGEGWPRERH